MIIMIITIIITISGGEKIPTNDHISQIQFSTSPKLTHPGGNPTPLETPDHAKVRQHRGEKLLGGPAAMDHVVDLGERAGEWRWEKPGIYIYTYIVVNSG
jgi:hypothetical protein